MIFDKAGGQIKKWWSYLLMLALLCTSALPVSAVQDRVSSGTFQPFLKNVMTEPDRAHRYLETLFFNGATIQMDHDINDETPLQFQRSTDLIHWTTGTQTLPYQDEVRWYATDSELVLMSWDYADERDVSVYHSTDGVTWAPLSYDPFSDEAFQRWFDPRGFAYANGQWIYVDDIGLLSHGPSLDQWVHESVPVDRGFGQSGIQVVHDGSRYLLSLNGLTYLSDDLSSFTPAAIGFSRSSIWVAHDGVFVGAGLGMDNNQVTVSTDGGRHWTYMTFDNHLSFRAAQDQVGGFMHAFYQDGAFLLKAWDGQLYRSTDGTNWKGFYMSSSSNRLEQGYELANGRILGLTISGQSPRVSDLLSSAAWLPFAYHIRYEAYADMLSKVGIFKGTGSGFDLARPATRAEAAVMFVRLLGAENDALAAGNTHPFKDVPSWASAYVGYLYANGLTKGAGSNLFGSNAAMTLDGYMTFVLRALGYSDADGDFQWNTAATFAASTNLLQPAVSSRLKNEVFYRDQLALLSYCAMKMPMKADGTRLVDQLVSKGAVNRQAAVNAALVQDPTRTETGLTVADEQRLIAYPTDAFIMDPGFPFGGEPLADAFLHARVVETFAATTLRFTMEPDETFLFSEKTICGEDGASLHYRGIYEITLVDGTKVQQDYDLTCAYHSQRTLYLDDYEVLSAPVYRMAAE